MVFISWESREFSCEKIHYYTMDSATLFLNRGIRIFQSGLLFYQWYIGIFTTNYVSHRSHFYRKKSISLRVTKDWFNLGA